MAKVLLLEDVEYCLRFYRAALIAHGFTVLTTANADEAARCCAQHPDIALIVAEAAFRDKRNGEPAAETFRGILPSARILYVSAYPLEHLVETGGAHFGDPPVGVAFLAKPFTARTFIDAVRRLLACRAACA